MNNLVSIIVPYYNVKREYFRKCIDSLINQTYDNIEIIIVDDGSKKEYAEECEKLKYEKKVKVIHKKNGGLSSARNEGQIHAKGKWMMFIDADDYLELDTIEKVSKYISNDINYIGFGIIRESNNSSKKLKMQLKKGDYSNKEDIKQLKKLTLNFNANISSANAKLFNRDFLIKNNIYHDETLKQGAEGIEFNIRLLNNANNIKYIKEYMYHYVDDEQSITKYSTDENIILIIKCFEKIKEEMDDDKEILKCFYNRMSYVIITSIVSGYFSKYNKEKYKVKKEKLKEYIEIPIVKETLNNYDERELDNKRKLVMKLIKRKWYLLLYFINKVR